MNFENNLITDIIESRTHDILSDYFFKINIEERKKVEYICTDMSFIFKPLLKTFFPCSTLLVDHFHITKLVNDQLNNTRKRVMRKYSKNKKSVEYRLLKHRYRILLKSGNKINNQTFRYDKILECHVTESKILETLLSYDEELRQAYNANGMTNFQRARNRILYSQNKYETYTMNEKTDRIKRIGNPRGTYKK